jgi:hypothetical protein
VTFDKQYYLSIAVALALETFVLGYAIGAGDLIGALGLAVVVAFCSVFVIPPALTVLILRYEVA